MIQTDLVAQPLYKIKTSGDSALSVTLTADQKEVVIKNMNATACATSSSRTIELRKSFLDEIVGTTLPATIVLASLPCQPCHIDHHSALFSSSPLNKIKQ